MVHSIKQMREYVGDEEVAYAKGERGGEDEAVAAREAGEGEDAATRNGDGGEEEGGYAAQDRVGNCKNTGRKV